jgi:hypothetical protein
VPPPNIVSAKERSINERQSEPQKECRRECANRPAPAMSGVDSDKSSRYLNKAESKEQNDRYTTKCSPDVIGHWNPP